MTAHVVREVNDWSIKKCADLLVAVRDLAKMLGSGRTTPEKNAHTVPLSYTQVRDIWEETFTAGHRGAVTVIVERLIGYCCEHVYPAPDNVWNTGARLSCVHSLDIDDFDKGEESIKFRHGQMLGHG